METITIVLAILCAVLALCLTWRTGHSEEMQVEARRTARREVIELYKIMQADRLSYYEWVKRLDRENKRVS